jgi:hypothetical protein
MPHFKQDLLADRVLAVGAHARKMGDIRHCERLLQRNLIGRPAGDGSTAPHVLLRRDTAVARNDDQALSR